MQILYILHWYFLSFLIGGAVSYGDEKKKVQEPSFVTMKNERFFLGKEAFHPIVLNYGLSVLHDNDGNYHVVPDIRQGWLEPDCGFGVSIGADPQSWRKVLQSHLHKTVELGFNTVRLVGLGFKYQDEDLLLQGYWRQLGKNNPECYYYTSKPVLKLPDHMEMFGDFFAEVIDLIKEDSIPLKLILLPARHLHEKKNDTITAYYAYLADRFRDEPVILAWDLYNEPNHNYIVHNNGKLLTKYQAAGIVNRWCDTIRKYDPNHLITLGPLIFDVFDWDTEVMDIDFISLHVYPILKPVTGYAYQNGWNRYLAVLRNFSSTQTKPWIIGETGSPGADPDTGPYHPVVQTDVRQAEFARNSMQYAKYYGALGYSWWMLKDLYFKEDKRLDENTGRQSSYGLLKRNERELVNKPAADVFKDQANLWPNGCDTCLPFPDEHYYNPWDRNFYYVSGSVRDDRGRPVSDALIKYHTGNWKMYWTFSDKNGRFKAWCDAEDERNLAAILCSYPGKTTFSQSYLSGSPETIEIVLEDLDPKLLDGRSDR